MGGLWHLNERHMWMSMRAMSVNASSPDLEERYWDIFPSQSLRFWPLFMRRARDLEVFLEKTAPVLVNTRMTGIGSFVADITLLSPHVVIEWQGEMWCISEEGRMWNLAEGSFGFSELQIPMRPIWRMQSPSLIGENNQFLPSGVFPSIFSTELIDSFLKGLGNASWFDGVEEIALSRRAGDDLFELRYAREGKNFTILIQKSKHDLEELGLVLEYILNRLRLEGGNHLIDATYNDKVVVKSLPAGAGEGSSR